MFSKYVIIRSLVFVKPLSVILFLFISPIIVAQNLVSNPSFEDFYDCPRDISFFHKNVKHWSIPNNGTTDYFNACSEKMGFKNFIGYQKARTGTGYAGIHTYYKKDYREYIQGKLKQTLKRDKKYNVTFYISLADSSKYAIKRLGFMTSSQKFNAYRSKTYIDAKTFSKRISNLKFHPIIKKNYLDNSKEWTKISFTYTAKGFENYFCIGNFNSNSSTEKSKIPSRPDLFSYYYIDDVSITPLEIEVEKSSKTPIIEASKEPLKTNAIYTFKNVLFDFDKAELLAVSIQELNALYNHLKEQPTLNIEIYGHTDNVGLAKRNKALSEQRAQAVANYLIAQGLDVKRISAFGFGSSKPITDNDTEANRQLNRRVEFKLIKK